MQTNRYGSRESSSKREVCDLNESPSRKEILNVIELYRIIELYKKDISQDMLALYTRIVFLFCQTKLVLPNKIFLLFPCFLSFSSFFFFFLLSFFLFFLNKFSLLPPYPRLGRVESSQSYNNFAICKQIVTEVGSQVQRERYAI